MTACCASGPEHRSPPGISAVLRNRLNAGQPGDTAGSRIRHGPVAEIDLDQFGVDRDVQPEPCGDRRGGLPRAFERARHDRGDRPSASASATYPLARARAPQEVAGHAAGQNPSEQAVIAVANKVNVVVPGRCRRADRGAGPVPIGRRRPG